MGKGKQKEMAGVYRPDGVVLARCRDCWSLDPEGYAGDWGRCRLLGRRVLPWWGACRGLELREELEEVVLEEMGLVKVKGRIAPAR